MEWVIRVIWDVHINREIEDLEAFSGWIMENIDDASVEAVGNEEFFPHADRLVEYFDDNSGFRIDMSLVTSYTNKRSALILTDVARAILQNSGANMGDVAISYEPIL